MITNLVLLALATVQLSGGGVNFTLKMKSTTNG